MQWGFAKQQIRADIESMCMINANDDEVIVKIVEYEGSKVLEWFPVWHQWSEFIEDNKVKLLIEKFQDLMARGAKGKGKGKDGTRKD